MGLVHKRAGPPFRHCYITQLVFGEWNIDQSNGFVFSYYYFLLIFAGTVSMTSYIQDEFSETDSVYLFFPHCLGTTITTVL